MFRRKKREDEDVVDPDLEVDADDETAPDDDTEGDSGVAVAAPRPLVRPRGPWDVTDVPDDGVGRIDLGSLRVPVPPDTEVRVDVSPEGEVVAATLVQGEASMQVNVFAAPRSEGIWQEVCDEIQAALLESGGKAEQREGRFGSELHALVPTEVPGQGLMLAPARFVGVDGPRWFLRALLTGSAAVDAAAAAPLEAALRDVVVVRGPDPMAVRDPLPLRLPAEAQEQVQDDQGQDDEPDGRPACRCRSAVRRSPRSADRATYPQQVSTAQRPPEQDRPSAERKPGMLRRALARLTVDEQEIDRRDLREEGESVGATAVVRCTRGEPVCVSGTIKQVVLRPRAGVPTLEAEVYDGTGSVTLVWLGRRRIRGVDPGRSLVARGRMTHHDGRPAIYNPAYELRAAGA